MFLLAPLHVALVGVSLFRGLLGNLEELEPFKFSGEGWRSVRRFVPCLNRGDCDLPRIFLVSLTFRLAGACLRT